jgi:hypothetical protein
MRNGNLHGFKQRTIFLKDIELRLGEGFIEFIYEKNKNLLHRQFTFTLKLTARDVVSSQTFFMASTIQTGNKWILEGESQRFPISLKWELQLIQRRIT